MKISHIVAIASNNAIGKNNQLLWHLPKDMEWFKKTTITNPVIMGRLTMSALKKPLPNRRNIVLSSNPNIILPGFEWAKTVEQAILMASKTVKEEIYIIGGGKVYEATKDLINKLYITEVDAIFEDADTFYPEIDYAEWELIFEEQHEKDEKHKYDFTFKVYDKKVIEKVK